LGDLNCINGYFIQINESLTEVINWQRCGKRTQAVRLRDIEGKGLQLQLKFASWKNHGNLNKN